jgi:alkylation response protein AidB-like acyl-CoA dehydrogenase
LAPFIDIREMSFPSGGLDPGLTERLRQVVDEHIAPRAPDVDREARWPAEGMAALLEAGFGGLVVPKDVGGLGYGLSGVMAACEIIGRACASTALCFGMHCVGTAVIAAKATPYQKAEYLVPIARGEHITTLALSEHGSGSHFYLPLTELRHSLDGNFSLNGSKSFITNGGFANSYVLSVVDPEAERPAGEFSCIVLKEGAPGVKWAPPWRGLGMRGNASRGVELNDVHIPAEDLLGEEGDQIWYIFNVVAPYFLSAMSSTYLGVASAALDEAVAHLQRRCYSHSGHALSDITVLQHRVGELWAQVQRTRHLVYYAGAEGDRSGEQAIPALCSAKADVAECVVQVVNEAMTLMGGIAYGEHGTMGRLMRDARAAHVMAPTTDLLRVWTGRYLLGLPLLQE